MAMIPRLETDTPKSYQALCDYAAMGPARSLDALCERYRSGTDPAPPTRRLTTLKDWSRAENWQARCQAADDALAAAADTARTAAYIAALEAHRTRASDAGEALYILSTRMLRRMNEELDTLELTPATLGILLRAYTTALDLSAHSLGIQDLLPTLEKEAR